MDFDNIETCLSITFVDNRRQPNSKMEMHF